LAEPFLSEIRVFSFQFAPKGWAMCNGQLMPISQNQALFSLLGTTYGGDGRVNFALPDLRGRTPIHVGSGHWLGERGGEQAHTISVNELPAHTHAPTASTVSATLDSPVGNAWADGKDKTLYSAPQELTAMNATLGKNTGGSQAHLNMQPFITLNVCIALQGIFPSPN
jgi:microcystin-dependent protein